MAAATAHDPASVDPKDYPLLARVHGPRDLDAFTSDHMAALAGEIRRYLVQTVARTGGHLGPNLGVVELTLALHRVFHSPQDTLIFDTGHQAYVHKLLTGRQDFSHLREAGGVSGYPSRAESEHDVVENSHASTALSWADGIARARQIQGHSDRQVVAVIGDGALTGGMAWEALNNIADSRPSNLVIVVNDNGRSYAPTIGGLAHHLDALRTNPGYERMLAGVKKGLLSQGAPGRAAYDALHGLKRGLKDVLVPSAFFEDLGLKYTGPVDGHDEAAVEFALTRAREFTEPVIVHVITEKGRGYTPAEQNTADRFHAVGQIHPETGLPVVPERFGWTAVFADEILRLAGEDERIIGMTAAMQQPVGLQPLADAYPERVIDVGIAEQHALTAAAGLAFEGLHPVIALYATFLNRAFDQLLMDVALHHAGVTIVLDRAGITGTDGASHNGVWDMALLAHIPGLELAAPHDEASLRAALRRAVTIQDRPTVIRYPKGTLPEAHAVLETYSEGRDAVDLLFETGATESAPPAEKESTRQKGVVGNEGDGPQLTIVAIGAMVDAALAGARELAAEGERVRVLTPHWAIPTSEELVEQAGQADAVLVVEDGILQGGVGQTLIEQLSARCREAGAHVSGGKPGHTPTGLPARRPRFMPARMPVTACLGVPRRFVETDSRAAILHECGMDSAAIAATGRALLAALHSVSHSTD